MHYFLPAYLGGTFPPLFDVSERNFFFNANKLTLNMTKTEFMLIGSRQRLSNIAVPPALEINGACLKQVTSTKSLGVIINENLTWSNHIDTISKKISSGIGAVKRVNHCLPPSSLHNIYYGLIQPHLDYCSVVWDNCGKTLSNKLQRLQNRAARVLTCSSYDSNANQLLQQLNRKKLETRRKIQKAEMVYKCLNGLAPDYLSSKFIQRKDIITSYDFRDSENKLAIPLPRTNYGKNSFSYSRAVLWNRLPATIRTATSLSNFSKVLNNDTAFMENRFLFD